MQRGRESGGRTCGGEEHTTGACAAPVLGIGTFVRDDGGYTTVAVAVAMLLSVTLTFGVAVAQWGFARSADVQEVADAAAMSGQNCVAAFSTIAQVLDACVLSMGLLGVVVYGAGMVIAAIPVLQGGAPKVLEAGRRILRSRKDFAKSASDGLGRLEKALPALVVANSASTVSANSRGSVHYAGIAVPYPQESESDFSYLDDGLDGQEMEKAARDLQEASARKAEAERRADGARERAWRADNVNEPACLQSRAADLAGLRGRMNPRYDSPKTWRFDFARRRAVNYYVTRSAIEIPASASVDEIRRSSARSVFFRYASEELANATCVEGEGRVCTIDLPELPHTTEMVRRTSLYTARLWPCTSEPQGRTLHCSTACPGAQGPRAGVGSLSEVGRGTLRCERCGMDDVAMGNVADASTNINNGFEHYWRIVVEASRDYQDAREDMVVAEDQMKEAAERSGTAFEKAMDQLSVQRPKLRPPGAYGCIGIVMRDATELPHSLTGSFLDGGSIPAGVAISGAALAPDGDTDGHDVLSSVFDGFERTDRPLFSDLLDGVGELWGSLLVGYGSAYGNVSAATDRFLDGIGGVFGEKVASWMRGKISDTVRRAGFEPSDMRLRKPVLTNTQNILDRSGGSKAAEARRFIQSLPNDHAGMVAACRDELFSLAGAAGAFTIAEIPIPGLEGVSIPLTIDLTKLGGTR